MGAENYSKACFLLDYFVSSLLGPDTGEGEGDPSAMDARLRDGPSEFATMFPNSPNPRLAPHAGARDRDRSTINGRVDPQAGELAKMF